MAELQVGQAQQPAVSAQEVLDADEWHELLPIEKKLIGYSFGLGVILLIIFIFAFGVFK